MPKLSKKYLELRFNCQYCGKSLRTRQGLAGHIRFRHPDGKKSIQDLDYLTLSKISNKWVIGGKIMDQTKEEIELRQDVLKEWPEVKVMCESIGIKVTNSDFKTYILFSIAQIHISLNLKKQLISAFKEMH